MQHPSRGEWRLGGKVHNPVSPCRARTNMIRASAAILLGAFALLLGHAPPERSAQDLVFSGTEIVMPTIDRISRSPTVQLFELRNTSGEAITVRSVAVGCGCITVAPAYQSLPARIPPKGAIAFTATLDITKAQIGKFRYPVTIRSDVGKHTAVVIYSYKPLIDCRPRLLEVDYVPGAPTFAQASFFTERPVEVRPKGDHVTVEVQRSRNTLDLAQYSVIVRPARAVRSPVDDVLLLIDRASGTVFQHLPVRVSPAICGVARPAVALFRDGQLTREVVIEDRFGIGLEIDAIEPSCDWLDVAEVGRLSFVLKRDEGNADRETTVRVKLVAKRDAATESLDAGIIELNVVQIGS